MNHDPWRRKPCLFISEHICFVRFVRFVLISHDNRSVPRAHMQTCDDPEVRTVRHKMHSTITQIEYNTCWRTSALSWSKI